MGPVVVHIPRTGRVVALVAAVALAGLMLVQAPAGASAAGCPNEAIRAEQGDAGTALPDCRAYEFVSPGSIPLVAKATGRVAFGARAAAAGSSMAYFSYYPYQGASSSGRFFRARRGSGGWSLEAMSPQVLPRAAPLVSCESTELDYSDDLSASVLRIGHEIKQEYPEESFCGQPQEELVPGEPRGFANLLRRGAPAAPYELVNLTPSEAAPANAQFQAASADLSHVVFGEEAQLTPESPAGYDLYEWVAGTLRLVTFLPDGTPVRGDLAGATQHRYGPKGSETKGGTYTGTAPFTNAVSADGERVVFYAEGNLYLRRNAGQQPTASGKCSTLEAQLACTVQIDHSVGAGNSGGGIFQYASADGSRVFFTDESKLTYPSSAVAGKPDLYEYDVETSTLADRTHDATEAADVRGFSGAAADGSHLYFVAKGALTGAQENAQGEVAQANQPNLYLLEEGALTFVATLDSSSDRQAWSYELTPQEGDAPTGTESLLATRTSTGGRYFAFNSARGLSGGPAGTQQIFLYDAASGELACASCLAGGGAPPGPSKIPSPIASNEGEAPGYLPRGLTDGGQLFFTTSQPLVASDSDEVADVYEYSDGEPRLLSDGAGAGPSYFFDASMGGGDVFFATTDALVRADTDNALNLYDARVGGGFPEPPEPPEPCVAGESCRDAGSGSPSTGTPATPGYTGSGNVVPPKACKRGKVRRHGRCVKKNKQSKHKKKHHRRQRHAATEKGARR